MAYEKPLAVFIINLYFVLYDHITMLQPSKKGTRRRSFSSWLLKSCICQITIRYTHKRQKISTKSSFVKYFPSIQGDRHSNQKVHIRHIKAVNASHQALEVSINQCVVNTQPFISQLSTLSNICITACELLWVIKNIWGTILILRNIIKKLYNLTEGQDIYKMCYEETMSDKIIFKGKECWAGTASFLVLNYTLLRREQKHGKPKFGFYLALESFCFSLVNPRLHSQSLYQFTMGRGYRKYQVPKENWLEIQH